MDEELVQNFVMGAKIDPKVEMDPSTLKNILQLSNRKLLEESIEEDELQLLHIGILSEDSYLVTHYVKELMLPREDLHGVMQCYMRQHFAASNDLHEHPRGHSSWRESTRMKFMNSQMEYSKMRLEPSEHMWRTRIISIHLENCLREYAQEIWERIRLDPEMHTMLLDTKLLKATLLNTYNPMLMETILKKLREQTKEDDQLKSAGEM